MAAGFDFVVDEEDFAVFADVKGHARCVFLFAGDDPIGLGGFAGWIA